MEASSMPMKRQLPKLMACMTKMSLENLRSKALFRLDPLDAKGIRRIKYPLHECLLLELRESGFTESADYLQDLIYDNIQLLADDDIGIVVDLRQRPKYLEHVSAGLIKAEKYRDEVPVKENVVRKPACLMILKVFEDNKLKEAQEFLNLALHYAEKEKGIIWLAEKFFLGAIAVSSQYLVDGGRQKNCCKYHYAMFLLDKFPGADLEEPFIILTEVRDSAIGKDWLLYEAKEDSEKISSETVFSATAVALHGVLLSKAKQHRKFDPAKSETLSRLAERRAKDAEDTEKTAQAIIEIGVSQLMMNNLNNAQKSFERALTVYKKYNNIEGMCEVWMHLSAVMQRLGDYEKAAELLTEMGALAMENGLRRQLGRALHLLGELQLRRERPDLGTQHLAEAFQCFMGVGWQNPSVPLKESKRDSTELDVLYNVDAIEVYHEEAEQSRLMMAVSAGQELMSSYFDLLRAAQSCTVDQIKIIEWKLSHAGWWNKREHHQFISCLCPKHGRTPLDVLRYKLQMTEISGVESEVTELLGRTDTTDDIRKLRSSMRKNL